MGVWGAAGPGIPEENLSVSTGVQKRKRQKGDQEGRVSKLFWDKSRTNYALLFSGLATFSIFLQCPKISQAANSDWLNVDDLW